MPVLGITGGIAAGKTTFTHALQSRVGADVFDADACARELLSGDREVQRLVRAQFGAGVLDESGKPDRQRLREIVFAEPEKRRALEAILHPVIRARWTALASTAQKQWLFIDIPLLFETGAEPFFQRIVVVACSPATQRKRLLADRQLPPLVADRMLAAQLPIDLKIQKADHVIWNESSRHALDEQARHFADYLKQHHG